MRKTLWILALTMGCCSLPSYGRLAENNIAYCKWPTTDNSLSFIRLPQNDSQALNNYVLQEIEVMLQREAVTMNQAIIDKILTTIKCAHKHDVEHNPTLTVIDYSKPSSEKRLWIFDLKEKKLLFHTYVSHGIKSGILSSNYFSNRYNSKASSIGVYKTDKAYYGRHGLSMKLAGLEKGFNDNAFNRAVVMHGGWYVDEKFVKKYGRPGRSWGCPAVPLELTKQIIDTIKDNSLFVAYYPNENWFLKSKYLNCDNYSHLPKVAQLETNSIEPLENRDDILFAEKNNNNKREENEPIVVMAADSYQRIFNTKVPLKRMLRRQINHTEYVALNNEEFKNIADNPERLNSVEKDGLNEICFVIPVVKKVRGYYATEMQIVQLGKIKEVAPNTETSQQHHSNYTIHFQEHPSIRLKTTNQFIRWLGL
ncbi:murein L,D-transpeptidase catalytic domain family protein [Legionella nagasakiensis]|uniref:murein L,D-transpeptidase catalytic domain family protein n=1 Tax=Legionella nagasakiensis TaxID=535290 RepID=UPI001F5FA46D|nr:murein L,D-transpeptidase catalytic domain family protein [Legionella nagasakiensis]